MSADFPALFDAALKERGLTVRKFAEKVGVAWSFVHQVRRGHSILPLDKVESWAQALGLDGAVRADFIEAAKWAHIPVALRPWIAEKLAQVEPEPEPRTVALSDQPHKT